MAIVARLWVAGELVNAAKMNSISTDLTSVGTEIAAVSQTVTNAIAALGTASQKNIGTGDGNVPELDSQGHLANARLNAIPNTVLSNGTDSAELLGTSSAQFFMEVTINDFTLLAMPVATNSDNRRSAIFGRYNL